MELFDKDGNQVDAEGNVIKKKNEESQDNPQKQEAKPASDGVKPTGTQDPTSEELKAAQEQINKLKEQYKGSTDEALRLKQELDQVKDVIRQLQSNPTVPTNDEDFNQLVSEKGMAAAITDLIQKAVSQSRSKLRLELSEYVIFQPWMTRLKIIDNLSSFIFY